jgi:nucleoside-diphosphate-sugar epimerase
LKSSLEVDDAAIRGALGWMPPFSFEEGLRLTAAWYRNR